MNCGFAVCVDVNDMAMDAVHTRHWSWKSVCCLITKRIRWPQTSGKGILVYRHVAGGCIQWMFKFNFFYSKRQISQNLYNTSELNTVRHTKCTKSILSIQNSKVFNININVYVIRKGYNLQKMTGVQGNRDNGEPLSQSVT